jgi:deoxycytidine triphosphate deaminase
VGTFTVDLRLGNQFRELPRGYERPYITFDPSKPKTLTDAMKESKTISVDVGDQIILQPGDYMLATTLEYIKLPADLIGMTFSRSSFGRIGLMVNSPIVDPSYSGKLTLQLINLGKAAIALYPGIRILRLAFEQIGHVGPYRGKYQAVPESIDFDTISLDTELHNLRNIMLKRAGKLQAKREPRIAISDLISHALKAKGRNKGKMLERMAAEIFRTIKGLRVLATNAHLKTEELDIVVQNDINVGFWRLAGSPIVVECKNWSGKVGAREISVLSAKLDAMGPDAKTGILIAPNGVSGDSYSNAMLRIREERQQGKYIIVLDRKALKEIAKGMHASKVIEKKYGELLLI